MTNLWTFETANFRIDCDALEEDQSPRDCFSVDWFCARVTVTHKPTGIKLGSDHLGACAYKDASDFVDGHRDANPMNRNCSLMRAKHGNVSICHYFPGMVAEAIAEARTNMDAIAKAA